MVERPSMRRSRTSVCRRGARRWSWVDVDPGRFGCEILDSSTWAAVCAAYGGLTHDGKPRRGYQSIDSTCFQPQLNQTPRTQMLIQHVRGFHRAQPQIRILFLLQRE